jgi:PKD repeat protein
MRISKKELLISLIGICLCILVVLPVGAAELPSTGDAPLVIEELITPADQVQGMIIYIQGMDTYDAIKSKLIAVLNNALYYLDTGNNANAVAQLNTFIRYVQAYDTRYILHDDAVYLIAEAQITLERIDIPPVADFTYSPETQIIGLDVTFDGSGSHDDGTILSYEWDFDDGNTTTGMIVTHAFATAGSYNVGLTVTDNDGLNHSTTKTVVISELPEPPGDPVERVDGMLAYIPTIEGCSICKSKMTSILTKVRVDLVAGNYDRAIYGLNYFIGYVHTIDGSNIPHPDAAYLIGEAQSIIEDLESKPFADFAYSPVNPILGQVISFDASASHDDVMIIEYAWDFGDGEIGSGVGPSHLYASVGTYEVSLTVTDNEGRFDTVTQDITVSEEGGSSDALARIDAMIDYIPGIQGCSVCKLKMLTTLNKIRGDVIAEDYNRAIYGLNYFIGYVQTIDVRNIPHSDAVYLISEANAVIEMLGS